MFMREEEISLLRKLIKIDTREGQSLQAANIVKDYLNDLGIDAEVDEYSPGKANLYAIINKGASENVVALSGHFDVVPFGDIKKWSYHPLSGELIDGYIWGRGSVDMKGGIVSIISAISKLIEKEKGPEVRLIFTNEEEINMNGAKRALKKKLMQGVTKTLITEPTSLNVGIAEKGVFWVKTTVFGKSAHGAYPHLGRNSIIEMTRLIPRFYEAVPSDDHELVGSSTLNVGIIKGGTKPNIVPEETMVILDYRISPNSSLEDVEKKLKSILIEEEERTSFNYKMEILHRLHPIENPNIVWAENFVNIVNELTDKNKLIIGLRYATDAAILCYGENTSLPFIIFGPGDPNLAHQTDERVAIKEVELAGVAIFEWLKEEA